MPTIETLFNCLGTQLFYDAGKNVKMTKKSTKFKVYADHLDPPPPPPPGRVGGGGLYKMVRGPEEHTV